MKNYYYLANALPQLVLGKAPEISIQELDTLLRDNLTPSDYRKVQKLRSLFDILNIRAFWKGEPLEYWGNLDVRQLEEELLTREYGILPDYVFDFLSEYSSREERLKHFSLLLKNYFIRLSQDATGFLRWYAAFERNLRLALVGFRVRQLHRDIREELQFEDPEEDIIAQLLAQKDAKSFEPPIGFEDLKPILEKNYKNPLELQQALSEYRFNKIDERLTFDPFSIAHILGYVLQYMMVEKWLSYDKQRGLEIVDTIAKEKS